MHNTPFKIDNRIYKAAASQHTRYNPLPGPEWHTAVVNEIDKYGNNLEGFDFYFNLITGQVVHTEASTHQPTSFIVEQLK